MSRIKYSTIPNGNIFGLAVEMMTIFTSLYRFNAFRNDDGQLNVNVNKTNLDNEWNAGNGACFRNNIFLPSYLFWGVLLSRPFFHPPSIRPTSSS